MEPYNPNDIQSVLTKILARLNEQDKTLERILNQTEKTNGRVTKIEGQCKTYENACKSCKLKHVCLWSFLCVTAVVFWALFSAQIVERVGIDKN